MYHVRFRATVFAAIPLLATVVALRYAPSQPQGQGQAEFELPACDAFALRDSAFTITVNPEGGNFDLGGGSRISFPRGAVTAPGRYNIRSAPRSNSGKVAGIRITAVGSAPTTFPEPIELRLSYAGCPFANTPRSLFIVRTGPGKPEKVGGARSSSGKFVEAALNRFSDFVIAM